MTEREKRGRRGKGGKKGWWEEGRERVYGKEVQKDRENGQLRVQLNLVSV